MSLSEYGTQFREVPVGETVQFIWDSQTNTIPVNIQYIDARVDANASTERVITGVTMSNTSCIPSGGLLVGVYTVTFTLSGKYGDDLATKDIYQVTNSNNYVPDASSFYESDSKPLGDFVVTTYTSYSELLAAKAPTHSSNTGWNHIIKFYPDDSLEKKVTYKFRFTRLGIITNEYETQMVHLIPTRHFTRLTSLIDGVYSQENPSNPIRTMEQYQFVSDIFTGNTVETIFGPMSVTPFIRTGTTEYSVEVYFGGSDIVVTPSMYDINGNYITFTTPPPSGEVRIYHTDDSGAWIPTSNTGTVAPPVYTSDPPGWVEPAE